MKRLWVQEWWESERGWGVRPDGHTVHLNREDIEKFVLDLRRADTATLPRGAVPDSYWFPHGDPKLVDVPDFHVPRDGSLGMWLPYDFEMPR